MTPPTQEKTMEWEKEFKKRFKKGDMISQEELLDYVKSLLASSQDSFRRKVEKEIEKAFGDSEELLYGDWKDLRAKLMTLNTNSKEK